MPLSKVDKLKMLMDDSKLSLTAKETESEALRLLSVRTRDSQRANIDAPKPTTPGSQNDGSWDYEWTSVMPSNAHNAPSWDTPICAAPKPVPTAALPICNTLGYVSPREMSFCPVQALAKFPYKFLHGHLRDDISTRFFAKGEFYNRAWDIYYIHPPPELSPKPLLLLSFSQVRSFIDMMSKEINTNIRLPSDREESGFKVNFSDMDDNHRPRHLGLSISQPEYKALEHTVPSPDFKPAGELAYTQPPTKRALAEFKAKLERAIDATKAKNKAQKAKKREERFEKQRGWGRQVKRTQRYLGLRQRRELVNPSNQLEAPSSLDVTKPAPHPVEGSVVFVAIDVEWYERDHSKITEIGISTLDAQNLVGVPLGEGGSEWMRQIQTRHFRIKEHGHLVNREFVVGCADRFEFGQSEWLSLQHAPSVIADCFRFPSATEGLRNIILVGHDISGDIDQLQKIGYNPLNLSNLVEIIDTSILHRAIKRDQQSRGLDQVLGDLDIIGWNTHNAGNDAAYTLQAMVGLAIKAATEKTGGDDWTKEKARRAEEAAARATETALDNGDGWSSAGEGSDGGVAKKPSAEPRGGKGNGKHGRSGSSAGGIPTGGQGRYPISRNIGGFRSSGIALPGDVGRENIPLRGMAVAGHYPTPSDAGNLGSSGIAPSGNVVWDNIPAGPQITFGTTISPDDVSWGSVPAPPQKNFDTTAVTALLKDMGWGGMAAEPLVDFESSGTPSGDTKLGSMPVEPLVDLGSPGLATASGIGCATAAPEPLVDLGLTCITTSNDLSEGIAAAEPVVVLRPVSVATPQDVDSETSPVESLVAPEWNQYA